MRACVILLLVLATSSLNNAVVGQGETPSRDEMAIRKILETSRTGEVPETEDAIFASGATPRPIIRNKAETTDAASAKVVDSIWMTRKNGVVRVRPLRVEVSKSGDLAYSCSDFTLEFDELKPGGSTQHRRIEGSQLRVWKKVNGKWLVAASFNRPNRQPGQ